MAFKPKDYTILLKIQTSISPSPRVSVSWKPDPLALFYEVCRKSVDDTEWVDTLDILNPSSNGFVDSSINLNTVYEYRIKKGRINVDTYNYLCTGIDVPAEFSRGTVLLVIDETIAADLAKEINTYELDLIGDGWQVERTTVPRAETFDGKTVKQVKGIIQNYRNRLKDTLKSIVLIGRVPVPYSGDFAVDDHPEHTGAWPADVYCGDFLNEWTDTIIYNLSASRPENRNIWGDGKFDQSYLIKDVPVAVGRIDFYKLPAMQKTELEMLKYYFDKNHKFRHKLIKTENRALIDDKFHVYSGEPFATAAWMNYTVLFDSTQIIEGRFRDGMQDSSYLWAYGCGPGSYNSAFDVAYSDEMSLRNYNAVFTMLLGSYFGDWDNENALMRCVIASEPSILTCFLGGRPFWILQHMGMGKTMGYSELISLNNQYLYRTPNVLGNKLVHISLMGDPTLRMHIVAPPSYSYISKTEVSKTSKSVRIEWSPSSDSVLGYYIFRAEKEDGNYILLNNAPVTENYFVDSSSDLSSNYYMVRAVKLEETASGSYYNLSQGVFCKSSIPRFDLDMLNKPDFIVYPNPVKDKLNIYFIEPFNSKYKIDVYDIQGRFLKEISSGEFIPGKYELQWNLQDNNSSKIATGAYLLKFITDFFVKTEMIFVY
ncbi:MAG: T9SS type A sorting domain-containing protein [Bacteroidota bacterium]